MNGRVLNFETPQHRDADLLLPWFASGAIEPHQRTFVQTHLAECTRCQRELEWLHGVADCIAEPCTEIGPDTERSWQRLRSRLDESHWKRVRSALQRARQAWVRTPVWTRRALAAQLVVCLGLVIFASQPSPPAVYRTLSSPQLSLHDEARLVVEFDPELSQDRLRDLLRACDARIVDGPGASGAYVLAVPRVRVADALAMLRAAPGVHAAAEARQKR